jgi:CDP-diacylglycerol--glycerol-3-phosphate 3-phosphatidyltransferase
MPKLNILPQRLPAAFSDGLGRTIARTGLTPNMLSCIGLAGNIGAAVLVAREELLWAGITFLVFSVVDLFDGAVARATGRATPYGAVLDAVFDRLGEGVVLAGIAWYFAGRGENVQLAVTFAAMLGGVSVSYLRARAEVEGLTMREGFFRRQERVGLLSIGLLFNALTLAVWPLAVLSHLTVIQRFGMLVRQPAQADSPALSTPAESGRG